MSPQVLVEGGHQPGPSRGCRYGNGVCGQACSAALGAFVVGPAQWVFCCRVEDRSLFAPTATGRRNLGFGLFVWSLGLVALVTSPVMVPLTFMWTVSFLGCRRLIGG